ncbi:MAG TPA: indolepyruvate oxidoreductase subunit beta family protein [Thermodesulfobacteriota bacterium]
MERSSELLKILIPAVGGQGGGVLTEWLVQAFMLEGFEVQGIGLPGLAQRGGSTVYYLEAHPKITPDEKQIIFSQYPVPGDVDVILAQEFLELGRILEEGYGSDKTTIITSTHRIYSTLEKMPISSGVYSDENLRKLAINFSSKFIGFNALEIAKENGMDELGVNAILIGALGASDALPISEATYLKAIEQAGVAVASNIKAFRIGWELIKSGNFEEPKAKVQTKWEDSIKERAQKLDARKGDEYIKLISEIAAEYPSRLREILTEAVFRLIDYQDTWYAKKYMKELKTIFDIDKEMKGGFKLTELFAKNLALLMSYEDGIRVADLKIKPERFKRIKDEMRLGNGQMLRVTDYLKPDAEEVYGLLPNLLVAPIVRFTETNLFKNFWPENKKLTLGQKPITTSFSGFLRLWFLTKLKFMRPYSYRYHREHSVIKKYKTSIEKFARLNYELGCLVAKSGEMIKGYGRVRRRTMDAFNRFLDNVITPLTEFEKKSRKGFHLTLDVGEKSLKLISTSTTDAITQAERLARDVMQGKAA